MIKLIGSCMAVCATVAALAGCGAGGASSPAVTTSTSARATTVRPATSGTPGTTNPPNPPKTATTPAATKTSPSLQRKRSAHERAKPEERLGKTPFLAATGRGFGAFHSYISKPLRKSQLTAGSAALKTATTAAYYAAREVRGAEQTASHERALAQLVTPLAQLASNLDKIGAALTKREVPRRQIVKARREVDGIGIAALGGGQAIQEITPMLR